MAISFTSKKSLQYAVFGAILGLYEIALSKGEIGMTKGEIAKNNFMQGYNCAQAVLLAFCDDLGFDEQTALMLASPFGGGIGRMREVCGTVTGMYMALGLARGYSDSKDNADKSVSTPRFSSLPKGSKRTTVQSSAVTFSV